MTTKPLSSETPSPANVTAVRLAGMRRSAARWSRCLRATTIAMILLMVPILGAAAQASEPSITAFKVKIDSAVVYASPDGVDLLCDVYSPVMETEKTELRPVVILIHGGAWSSGSRLTMGGHAMRLAKTGFVAISIDYRLAPAWKFPTQLDDVRRAMWWVASKHEELGIDCNRMGLFGYSAGGHLACLIGTLTDEAPESVGNTTQFLHTDERLANMIKPLAICAGGPPCDLTTIAANNGGLAYFLGGTPAEVPHLYLAASPVTHASAGDVPTLFIHGDRDAIVPAANSAALFAAQRKSGVQSEFVTIEKQGHMLTFINPKTAESMVDFFQRRLLTPE